MKLSSWQKVEQPDDCERIKKWTIIMAQLHKSPSNHQGCYSDKRFDRGQFMRGNAFKVMSVAAPK